MHERLRAATASSVAAVVSESPSRVVSLRLRAKSWWTSNGLDSVDAMVVTRQAIYDVDGLAMVGHLARPDGEGGPWPAVLIGHDGIGLEDYQRGRADLLADRGYIVLAMDYHAGRTYFGEPEAMLARVMPLLADPGRMRAVGRAALDVLLAEPGTDRERLAMVGGFGAGGRIVLELAGTGTRVEALAAIHPALPATTRVEDWVGVGGAFLFGTGSEDPLCTPEQLSTFTAVLQDAGGRLARQRLRGGSPARLLGRARATWRRVGWCRTCTSGYGSRCRASRSARDAGLACGAGPARRNDAAVIRCRRCDGRHTRTGLTWKHPNGMFSPGRSRG